MKGSIKQMKITLEQDSLILTLSSCQKQDLKLKKIDSRCSARKNVNFVEQHMDSTRAVSFYISFYVSFYVDFLCTTVTACIFSRSFLRGLPFAESFLRKWEFVQPPIQIQDPGRFLVHH